MVDVDEPMPAGWSMRLILYPDTALSSIGVGFKQDEEEWHVFKEYHRFDQGGGANASPHPGEDARYGAQVPCCAGAVCK